MENPATWGKAEKIIDKTIDDHISLMSEPSTVCGWSLAKKITEALRKEKLLIE